MRPTLEACIDNLERLQQQLGRETIPQNVRVWEDCYTHNLEALHHYQAWDELRYYITWFKDYKGVD